MVYDKFDLNDILLYNMIYSLCEYDIFAQQI